MADKTDNVRYHAAVASLRKTFRIRFHGHLGNELVALEPGRAVIQLNAGDVHLNVHGFVHGGVLATLLDSACGYSGLMDASGRASPIVTLTLTSSYTAPAKPGMLIAEGRYRAGGKRIFTASAEVTDTDGVIVAVGQGTFRRSGDRAS